MTRPQSRIEPDAQNVSRGFRTALFVVYGVFAVSATARALVQSIRNFSEAPLAFSLSIFAALTYVAIAVLLMKKVPHWTAIVSLVGVELVGVLGVGLLSYVKPEWFPKATVWSHFGEGYGYVPLVLPLVAGISVLVARHRESRRASLP
ncbi:hypothetical protein M3B90_00590 [Dermabacter sp. p3-SID358]|uniref:hypothetical protein n=1 Tax=Dermabacter sp. p3-SID358 TaxID=2916114 RepID=UPI0021A3F17B|nr:hypothetical protein [Dermabacter sp. p3-SID358]MCT1866031.1 hypothetical protein [Dermabacter sp. p3-SID358]